MTRRVQGLNAVRIKQIVLVETVQTVYALVDIYPQIILILFLVALAFPVAHVLLMSHAATIRQHALVTPVIILIMTLIVRVLRTIREHHVGQTNQNVNVLTRKQREKTHPQRMNWLSKKMK